MKELADRRIDVKTVMIGCDRCISDAREIIREINKTVSKKTKSGWVLASRVAEVEDVPLQTILAVFYDLYPEKRKIYIETTKKKTPAATSVK